MNQIVDEEASGEHRDRDEEASVPVPCGDQLPRLRVVLGGGVKRAVQALQTAEIQMEHDGLKEAAKQQEVGHAKPVTDIEHLNATPRAEGQADDEEEQAREENHLPPRALEAPAQLIARVLEVRDERFSPRESRVEAKREQHQEEENLVQKTRGSLRVSVWRARSEARCASSPSLRA